MLYTIYLLLHVYIYPIFIYYTPTCICRDTAGQQQFHQITKTYYKRAHGIICVYDISDQNSLNNINYWINNIKQHASNTVQIILIGNKSDLRNTTPTPTTNNDTNTNSTSASMKGPTTPTVTTVSNNNDTTPSPRPTPADLTVPNPNNVVDVSGKFLH